MADHATRILQPSGFKRTMGCPGWGQLCDQMKIAPRPSGKYAAEGSVAHALGEACLRDNTDPAAYVGVKGWYADLGSGNSRVGLNCEPISVENQVALFEFTINEDMTDAVTVYVDEIRRKRASMVGAVFAVEQKLKLDWLVPGMSGTGDHVAIEPLGRLCVDDYKHGAGVAVEVGKKPGDNPQLTIYALGALEAEHNPHMVEEVVVTIVQPRAPHPDGPIRSITYDVEDLLAWGKGVLMPAAQAAQTPGAKLCSGEWCRWCDAEAVCPELRKKALDSARVMFDGDNVPMPAEKRELPPSPVLLTGEQLDRILSAADQVESWIKAVREEAYQRLDTGHADAPGAVKLVAGKLSNRAYAVDDSEVYDAVKTVLARKDVLAEKALSPAQLEKVLKRAGLKPAEVAEYLAPLLKERKPGKPLMVPVDDRRPALPPAPERMFA